MEWKCKGLEHFFARHQEEFFKDINYLELAKVMIRFETLVEWHRPTLMLLAVYIGDPYVYFTQVLAKTISRMALEVFMARRRMYRALGTLIAESPCTPGCTHPSRQVSALCGGRRGFISREG